MKIILFVKIIELYLWRYVPELKAAVRRNRTAAFCLSLNLFI